MSFDVFTDDWARAWCERINENSVFKDEGTKWEWPLILKMNGEPGTPIEEDRAVYVDLHQGTCRGGRAATSDDLQKAPFIVSTDAKTWKKILEGNMDIITGIMWGKIKLERGDFGKISKQVPAATQLVVSATKVDSLFPDGL
jgi:putative sterol carrier protein